MFGFQRVGDLCWAAGDMRARGFLVGGTAGRTTLNGEGLQHEDGHSHLLAGAIPNCRAYDPTFSYEVAVILQDGVRRMLHEQEDTYYYITVMNENYSHPDMPKSDKGGGSEDGIIKGMYLFRDGDNPMPAGSPTAAATSDKQGKGNVPETDGPPPRETQAGAKETVKAGTERSVASKNGAPQKNGKNSRIPRVQLLGSGTILREVIAASELLENEFGVVCDIWSCPSFSELRKDGFDAERWNRLHPEGTQRVPYVTACLADRQGPAIAATDYVREYADQIRAFMPDGKKYTVLGTDGFGRSDTRENLRRFFEVDRYYIAQAAISALAAEGKMTTKDVARAIKTWKLDGDKPNPVSV
jgi:pyruvate dehydrogenase E1 component